MTPAPESPLGAVTGLAAVAVDCAEPLALARFWQRLLGGRVIVQDDELVELVGGAVRMDFARVAEPKTTKNRLHLDLATRDHDAAVRHAVAAGARVADEFDVGRRWTVLRDPEGNEFCLLRPADDPLREAQA